MVATQTFTDFLDLKRVTGEEWLITLADAEAYIPDVYEEVRIFFGSFLLV